MSFLLYHGVIITFMMVVTFALFLWEVAHRYARNAFIPFLGLIILLNTFESLAGKGVLLAKFIVMIVAFIHRVRLRLSHRAALR